MTLRVAAIVVCILGGHLRAEPGTVQLISVRADGVVANRDTYEVSISDDGTRAAFQSDATNLLSGVADGIRHVFVKDAVTGELQVADQSLSGALANSSSHQHQISGDGRRVVFQTQATNLDPRDTDDRNDVYLKDLETGDLFLVSTSAGGQKSTFGAFSPALSGDGFKVVFVSTSVNLHAQKTNPAIEDVFWKDVTTGELRIASSGVLGNPGNRRCSWPAISDDGGRVAFQTRTAFVAPDVDDELESVYVKDIISGEIMLASVTPDGVNGNGSSARPSMSADGIRVAFESDSNNFLPEDMDQGSDVYVKDLATGELFLASITAAGFKGGGSNASISNDGVRIEFISSSDMHPDDSQGDIDVFVKDLNHSELVLASSSTTGTKANGRLTGISRISGDGNSAVFVWDGSGLAPGANGRYAYVKDVNPLVLELTPRTAFGACATAPVEVVLDNPCVVSAISFGVAHDARIVRPISYVPTPVWGGDLPEFLAVNVEAHGDLAKCPRNTRGVTVAMVGSTDAPNASLIAPGKNQVVGAISYEAMFDVELFDQSHLEFVDCLIPAATSPPTASTVTCEAVRFVPFARRGGLVVIDDLCEPVFRRGDCNGDGLHDISDTMALLYFLFEGGSDPPCQGSCDANDDSTLDVADALRFLGYLFLGEGALSAPFLECGTDPTEDELSCDSNSQCRP